jgi:hypothetical protein
MKDLIDCVAALKFTKHGVRVGNVAKITDKRAKSNEISFRIRNNRGNLSATSAAAPARPHLGAAPGAGRKNGIEDFHSLYRRMEAASLEKLSLLNKNVVHHIGKTFKSSPGGTGSGKGLSRQASRAKGSFNKSLSKSGQQMNDYGASD